MDYYLFRLGFDLGDQADANGPPLPLPYVFAEIDGFSWGRAADFDVILGMDILRQCDLDIRRDGRRRLAFGT